MLPFVTVVFLWWNQRAGILLWFGRLHVKRQWCICGESIPLFSCFRSSHEDLFSAHLNSLIYWLVFPKYCIGNGSREPETLQPYLDLLVDELLQLSGKSVYDSYSKAPFLFKCEMLSYVLDYPGVGKVFNVLGSGAYKACAWCEIQDKYCLFY